MPAENPNGDGRTAQAVASMYVAGGPVHRREVGPHSMKLVVDARSNKTDAFLFS